MEEIDKPRKGISRSRRPITVCCVLFLILIFPVPPLLFVIYEASYVSRFVSVTMSPFDNEMFINFEFYNSNADIETGGDTIAGHGRRLDPSDSLQTFGFPISLYSHFQYGC